MPILLAQLVQASDADRLRRRAQQLRRARKLVWSRAERGSGRRRWRLQAWPSRLRPASVAEARPTGRPEGVLGAPSPPSPGKP